MFMNEYEIDEAVRQHGQAQTPLGEAVRAMDSLRDAVNGNSDGWPYWPAGWRAGQRLAALIEREKARETWSAYGTRYPGLTEEPAEVSAADVRFAMAPVKSLRTRRGLAFDITDAERAATAASRHSAADVAREARTAELADRFFAVVSDAVWDAVNHPDDFSDGDIQRAARQLAELAQQD